MREVAHIVRNSRTEAARVFLILVAIGWIYVVALMALAEATAPNGSVLGAVFTFLGWGVLPLALVLYIGGTPGRKRRLREREAATTRAGQPSGSAQPDGRGHAAGDPVAPEGKETR
jgi:hypothetical protein